MTAYNRADYIAEAIESVLNSSLQNFELIVVDDCSTDHTVEVIKKYSENDSRISFFVNEFNLGDYPNRNKAASYAKGKYLKYVDSDDIIKPEGLKTMVDAMELFPKAAFGFSQLNNPDINTPYSLTGEEALRKHFLGGGLLQAGPSTSIISTQAFRELGGFSGKRFISDYEAWLLLCLEHPVVIFSPDLIWIRNHIGQEMDVGKLQYYSLNYNLHKFFIQNPENPFTEKERKQILYNYRILLGRRVYQRLLRWFGLKKTLQTIKASGENGFIFLWAFFPMKKFSNERV